MFEVSSPIKVWIFTFCLVIIAIIVTLIDIFIIFPPDLRVQVIPRAMMTIGIVGVPIGRFVFGKMYQKHLMSQELQRLLNRDRLTDAATRDFFFARMEADPQAYGTSLMVDIDHFKSVNDRYGHLAGDEVIKQVAKALRDSTRAGDIVCRFGGEEFVIFIKDATAENGYDLAEAMRERIARQNIVFNDTTIAVTVSIGGAMKDRLADVSSSIQEADEALYRAKRGGRNRTIFAASRADSPLDET